MSVTQIIATKAGATLATGSYLEIELDAANNAGTYVAFCVDSLPELHPEASEVDVSKLCDTTKRYLAGMSDTPDIELGFTSDAESADLDALLALADAKEVVKFRFVYANGIRGNFDLALKSRGMAAAEKDSELIAGVKGKVSGEITWDKVA